MIWVIAILCIVATPAEAWSERKGEKRKEKVGDAIALTVYALCVCLLGLRWIYPLKPLVLLVGFRVAVFDYLVHWLLKKYSESHRLINVWKYSGKTTYWWDQLVAKIPWRLRLILRAVILLAAAFYYFVDVILHIF